MFVLLSLLLLLFPVSVHLFLWNYSFGCLLGHVEKELERF